MNRGDPQCDGVDALPLGSSPEELNSNKSNGEAMIDYKLEHIFSYTGTLASPPEMIGPVPEGTRVNFYSTGGEITGPRLRGRIRPVGGDWVTVRKDGVAILDVRTTFETHDGALILVTYQGLVDFGEDGHDKFLRGDLPEAVQLRISPRLLTSHPEYLWLNRLHCFGVGEYRPADNQAMYDVYAVL
jgi:Protein of unknown function (DUF3237)